ncbi:ATP-binding protein [Bhargavaea ullalensis]|uniref:histidine kinase n=1 Tax=Bhargavaea ullalensis TaxID=1265685 RepID=A0ABV2GD06_9BACL
MNLFTRFQSDGRSGKPGVSLLMRMIVLISLLVIVICLAFGLFLRHFLSESIEDQIGKRALALAEATANIPELQEAFLLEDPAPVIQGIVEPIRKKTGAEFIVVGNREGIRYSHPDAAKIGGRMVGGDNDRALESGESYISKKEGSLGLSVRGKVPVYSDGEVVGVVSVGFLNDNVQAIARSQSRLIWYTLAFVILAGLAGAVLISRYIKSLLRNMEPEEISRLYDQKEAILQSVREGIIAVDGNGRIATANSAARRALDEEGMSGEKHETGIQIRDVLPSIVNLQDHIEDREMMLGRQVVLVSQVPLTSGGDGAVITFRKKSDLQKMTEELSRIRQYANAQRAQTHEHSNKLHVILGLLVHGRAGEAVEFIKKEENIRSNRMDFLSEHVSDPLIGALLQGKSVQAQELGIDFSINPFSRLSETLPESVQDALLTALGNVIENAFDAVRSHDEGERRVLLFFTDVGDDLLFEVEDSGEGISEEDARKVFNSGFSTKGDGRGNGLALASEAILGVGGEVLIEDGESGGACFVISIPKNRGEDR